jgi:hypothetical protein
VLTGHPLPGGCTVAGHSRSGPEVTGEHIARTAFERHLGFCECLSEVEGDERATEVEPIEGEILDVVLGSGRTEAREQGSKCILTVGLDEHKEPCHPVKGPLREDISREGL